MTAPELHVGASLDDASEDEVMQLCRAVGTAATEALGMTMACALDIRTGCFIVWVDPDETLH